MATPTTQAAGFLVLCILMMSCMSCHAMSKVEDLRKNKREGALVWGEWYDIPKVGGARAWVFNEWSKTKKNFPLSAGIKLTKQFLDNAYKIPCQTITEPFKMCSSNAFINFAKGSIFGFTQLNFNQNGHPPKGVYDKPHFDIHFHLRTLAYHLKFLDPVKHAGPCPPGYDATTFFRLQKPIPAKCFPAGHINVGEAAPLMGNHLVNPKAKEFTKPGSFDATWIWGSFDGAISFFEPMITLKTFLDKKAYCGAIPGFPEEFPKAGYYPTTWCYYSYNNGDTFIELRDFVWKSAGCKDRSKLAGYFMGDPKSVPKGCKYSMPPKP